MWPDIWLNEGFATWSEWIYDERHGGHDGQQAFDEAFARPADEPFWATPGGAAGAGSDVLRPAVRPRRDDAAGAAREDRRQARSSASCAPGTPRNKYGNVTTADFIAAAERESHRQLDAFFDVWLFRPVKPATW